MCRKRRAPLFSALFLAIMPCSRTSHQVAVGKKGLQIEMTVPAGPMWLRMAQVFRRGEQRNRVAGSGHCSDRTENLDHSGQRLSQRLKVRCSRAFWTA
jgi:hypothetical protein